MLFELMVAIAVFVMTIVSALSATYGMDDAVARISSLRENLYSAQNILEYSLASRLASTSYHTSPVASSSFMYATRCIAKITGFSSSLLDSRFYASTTISTLIPDENTAKGLAYDCGGFSSEATSKPKIVNSVIYNSASTTLRAIDVSGNLVVIAGYSESTTTPNVLFLDAATLQTLSSLNLQNVNALDLAGNYLYAALEGTASQVAIIDISNILSPKIIATRTLPGVTGSFPSGLSIAYYNSILYVGTHRTAGNEFHIYDVSSPSSPLWLGSIELNHNINDIAIREPYAFLATSGNSSHVIVLDISKPKFISKTTSVVFNGTEDAMKVFLIGNELYAGRKKSASSLIPTLISLEIRDPQTIHMIASSSIPADITGIIATGPSVYVSTSKGMYLVSRDLKTSQKIFEIPGFADVENTNLFIASSSGISLAHP